MNADMDVVNALKGSKGKLVNWMLTNAKRVATVATTNASIKKVATNAYVMRDMRRQPTIQSDVCKSNANPSV